MESYVPYESFLQSAFDLEETSERIHAKVFLSFMFWYLKLYIKLKLLLSFKKSIFWVTVGI